MSVNVANLPYIINFARAREGGKKVQAKTKTEMKRLLKMPLNNDEKETLLKDGFCFSSPTKETLILVALYKKAISGDMNAIKEIRNMTEDAVIQSKEKVTIIDNVPNNDG
jgi:hypothetical protein